MEKNKEFDEFTVNVLFITMFSILLLYSKTKIFGKQFEITNKLNLNE